jgi:hypothetical protein
MTSPVPSGVFALALSVFVIILAVTLWRFPRLRRRQVSVFLGMFLFSLAFVLFFLFTQRKAEQQFVEVGYYFPLDSTQAASSDPEPTLRMGSASVQPDYVVDLPCRAEPCFTGSIDLFFNQRASGANLLTWEKSNDVPGSIAIFKPRADFLGRITDWLGVRRRVSLDERAGVELPGSNNRLSVLWSRTGKIGDSISIADLQFELTPSDAPPRVVVQNVTPPIIELPDARNFGGAIDAINNLPSSIYLTSSDQAIALKVPGRSGYIPTIKVGKNAPGINVNAFLERPDPAEGSTLILNDGLRRVDNPQGHRFYVGTDRGLVATVASRGSTQWKGIAGACVLIWLVTLFFFMPTVFPNSSFRINPAFYLLVSAIQMLLAVRIVLGMRAYFWEPYNRVALESALFAAILIPLLLFIGAHASGLSRIGEIRDRRGWQKVWLRYIHTFSPFLYWLIAIGLLIAFYFILRVSPDVVADAKVLAYQDLSDSKTAFSILLILPPLVWGIGLLLDRHLRAGRDPQGAGLSLWRYWRLKYGWRRIFLLPFFPFAAIARRFYATARRDNKYVISGDDPITYSILKSESPQQDEKRKWPRGARKWLLFAAGAGLLLVLFHSLNESGNIVGSLLVTVTAFLLGLSLMRLGGYLRRVNITIAVAARSVAIVAWTLSAIILIRTMLRPLGMRSAPEALLPNLPLRTTFFFEILILILSMRLLAAFFARWRDAETPFRMRGLTIVYVTPMLMLMLSVVASRDTGALLVHGPALVGATILITGLWPVWKRASGWLAAIWAVIFPVILLVVYYFVISTTALSYVINDPHGTTNHRVLLREGTEVAVSQAETGGLRLLGAIEQNWRMMNYAAEGGWLGKGYGNSRIPGSSTFKNITLDDLVFSTYVLAEHGAIAGIALLGLYFMIFLIVLRMSWSTLRDTPLRVALAGGLCMMLVFPAMYMAAANVNELIFTGQNLPLLNLRSHSEIVRSGIVLLLLFATLKPLSRITNEETVTAGSRQVQLGWFDFLRPVPGLIWRLVHRDGRRLKAAELDRLAFDAWAVSAVVASNLLLIIILVAAFFVFPVIGMIQAANDPKLKEELDLKPLKDRAAEYVKNRQIWFEPVPAGGKPGKDCVGGGERNRAAGTGDPTTAYQLCMDSNVKGGAEGDTFYHLVREWNARKDHRGNAAAPDQRHDANQFFELDLSAIGSRRDDSADSALAVNQTVYRWASPFRPRVRWSGALTEANAPASNAGVLVGSNLQLPLRSGVTGEPVFVGVNPGHVRVNLGESKQFKAERGFAVFEKGSQRPIFEIDTINGALGARLKPISGDFDLFLNGCRLLVGNTCDSPATAERGTAPPIRLDDGDVLAYARPDSTGRRVPQHVFIYSHAQIGSFSHLAWANGKFARFYPQGASWPMAEQITSSISSIVEPNSPLATQDISLTIDADLNHDVYGLLRRWRGCLDGTTPAQRCCVGASPNDQCRAGGAPLVNKVPISRRSSRKMAVTLMDTETGALLSLAADSGTADDPNGDKPTGAAQENGNLLRHRIGSAIKPFTAAATLRTFSELHRLTLVDQRKDKTRLLGLPFDGRKDLIGQGADANGSIDWKNFLPQSDNLYAATFSLLGMCRNDTHSGLPSFQANQNPRAPLQLVLTDSGTTLGKPIWALDNIFQTGSGGNWRSIDLLDKTPLAQQLKALFDVRVSEPQVQSYATDLWRPIIPQGQVSQQNVFNAVSPEITNFAFPDITNYADLRSVLLGGEFGHPSLGPYGRVGSAWSNVFLAQSFARLSSGNRVTASIVANPSLQPASGPVTAWFENAPNTPWRLAMLHELEGVVVESYGTAYRALNPVLNRIAANRPQYGVGSGQSVFTIVSKTGTLDPDGNGPLLEDSNFVFTAGIWNDKSRRFEHAVTGAIYIEQGRGGQAQAFAAALLSLLDQKTRFQWN